MTEKRVSLYKRLPEIYRIKDSEQEPPGQLESYLSLMEEVFSEIHKNIEFLYNDLFIETCDDWVIPYIGDLLGTSHLKGEAWSLRADVADTIALRRRKGTIGAIELLTYDLTKWGVHCVELREKLLWNQHLNHQRPDRGGKPVYGEKEIPGDAEKAVSRNQAIRGGTVTLRDPALLTLLDSPFDPFAHLTDLKVPACGAIRYNLPNLAIFLWRLKDYRVRVTKPVLANLVDLSLIAKGDEAAFIACFDIHPLGRPVRLFNTYRFDPEIRPLPAVRIDETPNPIPVARLTRGSAAGRPEEYVSAETYDHNDTSLESLDISDVGLQLHLPEDSFSDYKWAFRGDNLCAWEKGIAPPLKDREIAIDPVIGRIMVGVNTSEEADALDHILVTYTYGAVGPVGAHPVGRSTVDTWNDEPVEKRTVNFHDNPSGLQDALIDIQNSTSPILIEIQDSMVHELDLGAVSGTADEGGNPSLQLNSSLIIKASDNQRPIIRLVRPLRFRPTNVKGASEEEQAQFDAVMSGITVRLEGLYLARGTGFPTNQPLIARCALNRLEIIGCTLDPGGYEKLDGTRESVYRSVEVDNSYGFTDKDEEDAFNQIPEIIFQRSITGPLFIETNYLLFLTDSIVDAGSGVGDDPGSASFAVSGSAVDPLNSWGPPTEVSGITVFGKMRVQRINGSGGIWVHALEVLDNQRGCLKYCYVSGINDTIPQNHACVKGNEVQLVFTSEYFGHYAYGQLSSRTNFKIRERGPKDNQMGAFGFLLEAQKWRNLRIRFREFMPVGIRPLLIAVT